MSAIVNHFLSFHPIDLSGATILPANIAQKQDVLIYAADLIENVMSGKDQREYKFSRPTTEVSQAVAQMVGQTNCISFSQTVANRLLQSEQTAQRRVTHMGVEIQKGSLFQIVFRRGITEMILIAKIDLNSFLDQTDFKKHAGLPFEKRILKTFLAEFSPQGQPTKIIVSDAHNAEYWWKDFLELEEVTNDENNTKRAFHSVEHMLATRLKRKYPSDYTYLRNNLIGYFRTQKRFSFVDLQRNVFGSYKPDDSSLDITKLVAEIAKLPEKKKFDSVFNIVENAIKARFKRVISLTDKIKLELTEDVDNLSNTIEAKEIRGERGVFIRSEEGYNIFHRTN